MDSKETHQNVPDKFVAPVQDKDNVELGSPAAQTVNLAPFATSFINLIKTIIGSGILGLPFAVQQFGLIPGISLMFIAAATATFGLHIINVAAMQLGRKSSFSGICSITYPKAAFAFELAIALKCIGTSIAYLSAVGDMSVLLGRNYLSLKNEDPVPEGFVNYFITSKTLWVSFLTVCISPVCFMKRMDSLKYTSYAGMGAVVYLVILTVFNYKRQRVESIFTYLPLSQPFSLKMMKSFGMLIFSYTCHQNILAIQNEAKNNTPRGMMNVIGTSMFVATFFYLLVAIFGAASKAKVSNNILIDFPYTIPFNIARGLYILLLLASYPLQVFPCRNSVEKMTLFYLRAERLPKDTMVMLYLISTMAIIAMTAFVGTLQIKLDMALSIVGTVAGNFICYILPAILFNKLYEGTPLNWKRLGSYFLLSFGVVSFILSGIGIVAGLLGP